MDGFGDNYSVAMHAHKTDVFAISPAGPTEVDLRLTKSLEETLRSFNMFVSAEAMEARSSVLKKIEGLVKAWINGVGRKKNISVLQLERMCGKLYTFGSFELGVDAMGADIDTLCLAPRHIDRTEFFSTFYECLRSQTGIKNLRAIEDAYVPVIKLEYDGIEIDILFARLACSEITDELDLCDENLLKNLDIHCIRSLNGYRVCQTILRLISNKDSFRMTLRAIKLWATRKGIYSNVLGFLGGISWALLVAYVCRLYPNAAASTLVYKFFFVFSQWKWPNPVMLRQVPEDNPLGFPVWDPRQNVLDKFHLMPVITPVYPQQNSTYNVTMSSRTVMVDEFTHALEVTHHIFHGKDTWASLFKPSNFFQKYRHYLAVTCAANSHEHHIEWVGLVESKIRILIGNLERNHLIRLAHINPQSFPPLSESDGFKSRWFIGLTFVKQHGLDIDLTYDIQNFCDIVHGQAATTKQFREGMTVEVHYIRRKQLYAYLPDPVINPSGKPIRENHRIKPSESATSSFPAPEPMCNRVEPMCSHPETAEHEYMTPVTPSTEGSSCDSLNTVPEVELFRHASAGDSHIPFCKDTPTFITSSNSCHTNISATVVNSTGNSSGDGFSPSSKRELSSVPRLLPKRLKHTSDSSM